MNLRIKPVFSGNVVWILLLMVVAVIGFWPVISFDHPLKWDAVDYYFPSRHLLSQYIHQGEWPLWTPYQNLGYPMYADPQSGAWYPVSLLLASFTRYPLEMLQVEYFIHILLAGIGMFFLVRSLLLRHEVAFMAAVCYMLSGFFVSNAQHLTWMISAAWLPFVVWSFLVLLKNPRFRHAIMFSLSLFMMFSGGYPAFVFVLLYILLALWITYIVFYLREKCVPKALRLLRYSLVSGVLFALVSAFILYAEFQVLSWMSRGQGITAESALFGPFSIQSFVSFLSPYSVALADFSSLKTDISMANAYMGLLPLILIIPGMFLRKSREVAVLFWSGVVCLLASLGSLLPVREFLYHWFPLMDMFRFPAVFRLFFVFGALVLAAFTANRFVFQKKVFTWPVKSMAVASLAACAALFVVLRMNGYLQLRTFISTGLFAFDPSSTAAQHMAVDLMVALIILSLMVVLMFKNTKVISVFRFFLVLTSLQMIFSVRTNSPYTIVSEDVSMKDASAFIQSFPDDFPALSMTPVGQNEANAPRQAPFWKNLNLFNRQISAEGFTPFKARDFEWMQDSAPAFLTAITKHPPVYLTRNIVSAESIGRETADSSAVVLSPPARTFPEMDSGRFSGQITNTQFLPGTFRFSINCSDSCVVVLQQNAHPQWSATVNGQKAGIVQANFTEMALVLPPGKHQVVFEFTPGRLISLWIFSASVLVALMVLWLILTLRSSGKEN